MRSWESVHCLVFKRRLKNNVKENNFFIYLLQELIWIYIHFRRKEKGYNFTIDFNVDIIDDGLLNCQQNGIFYGMSYSERPMIYNDWLPYDCLN